MEIQDILNSESMRNGFEGMANDDTQVVLISRPSAYGEYSPYAFAEFREMLMAKLYFRYGATGSSKTANALMVNYNYHERGSNSILLKLMLENRDGDKIIKSRIGLQTECR